MNLAPKDPDVDATYTIEWRTEIIVENLRDTYYVLGAIVRPHRWLGFYLECTKAGRSSSYYPELPRRADQAFADGSLEWTTRDPASVSLPAVSTAVWTLPTGITKASQSESGTQTHITLSGGTDGVDYEIACRMTPTAGNAQDQTITVPVRHL